MQTSGQRKRVLDGSQSDIPEMEDGVARRDCLIPPTQQLCVHLVRAGERSAGELTDAGVAEVGVGRDEIDLVEIERRILGRCGHR